MSCKKERKRRSVFDSEQIRHLEAVFIHLTHYPDRTVREYLTEVTRLPEKKIQVEICSLPCLLYLLFRSGFRIDGPSGAKSINSVSSVVWHN